MKSSDAETLDVDVRFLLANERTLLAWIRTSIAIEAGGVALMQIHRHHSFLGAAVLLLGAVVALIGYHRFRAANRSIRAHSLPPEGIGPAVQVISVVVLSLVLAITEFALLR